ncbi:MAG: carboxypeptidase-like regulatory domain-containing protein, partial [Planctomycetota bacterium]
MSRASARLLALGAAASLALWVLWWSAFRPGEEGSVLGGAQMASEVAVDARGSLDQLSGAELAMLDEQKRMRGASGAEGSERVRLAGPGRLTGTVRIRGASGAGNGAGLGGAMVTLTPFPAVGEAIARHAAQFLGAEADFVRRVAPVAAVETDAAGAFSFEGVAEGRWYLSATANHHVQESPISARVLASGAGGPVEVWVRSGGRVVGRVVDREGRAVPDADVALATDSLTVLEAAADGELAYLRTSTNAIGEFAFPGVAPAEGYELAAIGAGISIVHARDVQVRAGEDTFVELVGGPGVTVRGRVVSTGETTVPLKGAQVAALPRGLRHLKLAKELLVSTHAVTDAEGRYELRHVPPGTSDLLGMAEAHIPGRGPALRLSGARGASFEAPDFALVRGPRLGGIVVDEDGVPLEGVRILWSVIDIASVQGEPSLAPIFAAGMKEFRFPVTGPDGAFVAGPFAGRRPYQIRAVKSGYGVGEVEWDGE